MWLSRVLDLTRNDSSLIQVFATWVYYRIRKDIALNNPHVQVPEVRMRTSATQNTPAKTGVFRLSAADRI